MKLYRIFLHRIPILNTTQSSCPHHVLLRQTGRYRHSQSVVEVYLVACEPFHFLQGWCHQGYRSVNQLFLWSWRNVCWHVVLFRLFTHITMKSHVQSIRYIVFKIIDSIMARHRDGELISRDFKRRYNSIRIEHIALKVMGNTFVAGYVQLAEGEKDPRNLLVSFSIIRVLLIEFDVTSQIEVSAFPYPLLASCVKPVALRTSSTSLSVTFPSPSNHHRMTLMASRLKISNSHLGEICNATYPLLSLNLFFR